MTFDATVTVGDVLTMIAGGWALLGLILLAVGSRYFPTKEQLKELRDHVDSTQVSTRQDVQNAVGKLELVLTQQSARLERAITDCTSEARSANAAAVEARHLADKAELKSTNSEKSLDQAVTRMERLVEGLLNRPRNPDQPRNGG